MVGHGRYRARNSILLFCFFKILTEALWSLRDRTHCFQGRQKEAGLCCKIVTKISPVLPDEMHHR